MPYLELPTGPRLHYVDSGPPDSEPFLLLHGMLGTAEAHLGQLIGWLPARYRVLGPTLRGYGGSTPKPRRYPPDFYQQDAADMLAFLDALDIPRAHLFGFSDGGETALIMAARQPERFWSVSVVGAPAPFDDALRALVTAPGYAERLAPTAEECALHGIADPLALAREWIAAALAIADSGGLLSEAEIAAISAPLLIILGEQDTLNPLAYARQYAALAQRGRVAALPGGHRIHQQQWDAFREVLAAFLDDVPA